MARSRNIKPAFFTNEELVELPYSTRLLFIGLWTIADREGRLEDRPKRIKMSLFPSDDLDINGALNELQESGFLLRYEIEGDKFIQILSFKKHQNPHKDEKKSEIPAPELHRATSVQQECEDSSNRALTLIPDSLIPDSPNQNEGAATPREEYSEEFEEAYSAFPSRPGSSKKKAFAAWNAQLKKKATAEEMTAGVHRYAAYVRAMKTEPQYIQMPATFFGPSENFKSNWAIPTQPRASPAYQDKQERNRAFVEELTGKRHEQRPDNNIIDIN